MALTSPVVYKSLVAKGEIGHSTRYRVVAVLSSVVNMNSDDGERKGVLLCRKQLRQVN